MDRHVLLIACAVLGPGAATAAGADGEAAADFEALFGQRVAAVQRTPSPADDVALAGDIADFTDQLGDEAALRVYMLRRAFELASMHPDGYESAERIVRLLGRQGAAARREAPLMLADLLEKRVRAERGVARRQTSARWLAALFDAAQAHIVRYEYEQAEPLLARAMQAASYAGADRQPVSDLLRFARERRRDLRAIDRLLARLEATPDDQTLLTETIHRLLEAPERAGSAATFAPLLEDETLKRRVTTLSKPVNDADAAALTDIGFWSHELSQRASDSGKCLWLRRADEYLSRYIDQHGAQGVDALKARLVLEQVRQTLASLPHSPLTAASPARDPAGLLLEVYADMGFTKLVGAEVVLRPWLGFGNCAPVPGAPHDGFGVRLTGFLEAPEDGQYHFFVTNDDQGTIWFNDRQVYQRGTGTGEFEAPLKKGKIALRFEVVDNGDVSGLVLAWQYGDRPREAIPASAFSYDPQRAPPESKPKPVPLTTAGLESGLNGTYYGGRLFQTEATRQPIANIDFNWGHAAPAPGVPADFTAVWEGYLDVPETGDYGLSVAVDDTIKCRIDGRVVLWADRFRNASEQVLHLTAGLHRFEAHFADEGGPGAVHLYWRPPGAAEREIIPESAFFREP